MSEDDATEGPIRVVIADDDLTAANTQDDPDRVVPKPHPAASVVDGVLTGDLPPASWSMFLVQVR